MNGTSFLAKDIIAVIILAVAFIMVGSMIVYVFFFVENNEASTPADAQNEQEPTATAQENNQQVTAENCSQCQED